MKRETQANLLFMIVFLALSLPGAFILFHKKLDPTSSRLDQPDPVRRRLPYMAPLDTPDEVVRFIPDQTGQWLSQITRQRTSASSFALLNQKPMLSGDRLMQIMTTQFSKAQSTITFLIWDERLVDNPILYEVFATSPSSPTNEKRTTGHVTTVENIPLPQEIRRELLSKGHVKPPAQVTWIQATFPTDLSTQPTEIKFRYNDGKMVTATSATLNAQPLAASAP